MEIHFLYPLFLLLLPITLLLWFEPRGLLVQWSRGTVGWRQALLRSLCGGLLIAALGKPVLLTPDTDVHQIVILDRSDSVPAQQQIMAANFLADMEAAESVDSVIVLGRTKSSEQAAASTGRKRSAIALPDARASSLSAALCMALQEIPDGSKGVITLLSDGLATDRHWGEALQTLIDRGIAVNVVPLVADENDVYPSRVIADPGLRVGQAGRLMVEVHGTADALRIRLSDPEGELMLTDPFTVEGRATVPIDFEPQQAGYVRLTAEVVVADGVDYNMHNNKVSTIVAVQDPLQVLYLGDPHRDGAGVLSGLVGNGFDVRELDRASAESELTAYDVVFIDDRPARDVPESLQRKLVDSVIANGMGLFVGGGRTAFGSGGYGGGPLAEALPINFNQRGERNYPSVSLAIIIDTSGSMKGRRMELAKQVARLAIRRLHGTDQVGIVEFYGGRHWAAAIQPAANRIELERAIGRMQAGGGTVLYPALEEAYFGLKNVKSRLKHILLISDAGIEEADYANLIRYLTEDGITVSTVQVGGGGQTYSLFDMAALGKGRFYSVSDRYGLVEPIFDQTSNSERELYRSGEFRTSGRGGATWWSTVDRSSVPAIHGYAAGEARQGGEVLLLAHDGGHPVLASWNLGLGRVTALTTEPLGAGTQAWRRWPDYGAFLARILIATASDYASFAFDVSRNDHVLKVRARRLNRLAGRPKAVVLPDHSASEGTPLNFHERAPGWFEAQTIVSPERDVRIVATTGYGDRQRMRRLVSPARQDVYAENQVDPAAGLDLRALAHVTGGAVIDHPVLTQPMGSGDGRSESWTLLELWPAFLLLALVAYLSELLFRRLPS